MVSVETRMICKCIDELTKEIRKLRKVQEKRMNYEAGIFAVEREDEEENIPPSL